jgi:hypothetical protein
VDVPWQSRQELLQRIRELDGPTDAFSAVGAASPVSLTRQDKVLFVQAINAWANDAGSYEKLPEGVWALRNGLFDDLVDKPIQYEQTG